MVTVTAQAEGVERRFTMIGATPGITPMPTSRVGAEWQARIWQPGHAGFSR